MGKNKDRKTLIIITCCLVAIIAILVVVIIILNNDKSPSNGNENISTEVIANNSAQSIDVDKDNKEEDKAISETTPEPTEIVTSTPTSTEVPAEPIVVTLGDYKGIEADYSSVIITDKDIDRTLNQLKSEYTEIVDMPERPFEPGDMAIVTYKGMVDGNVIDDLYVICLQVVLGRGSLPDEFEKEIIGRRKEDTFTVELDYPEEYERIPEVAGKTVVFEVELVDGFVFDIPEINNEFISRVTQYSTVDEYRTSTMLELQKEQDDIAYEAAVDEIRHKVVENASFSGPIDDEIKKKYVLRINALNTQFQQDYMMDAANYYNLFYDIPTEQYTASVMDPIDNYRNVSQKIQEKSRERWSNRRCYSRSCF